MVWQDSTGFETGFLLVEIPKLYPLNYCATALRQTIPLPLAGIRDSHVIAAYRKVTRVTQNRIWFLDRSSCITRIHIWTVNRPGGIVLRYLQIIVANHCYIKMTHLTLSQIAVTYYTPSQVCESPAKMWSRAQVTHSKKTWRGTKRKLGKIKQILRKLLISFIDVFIIVCKNKYTLHFQV